MKEYKLNINGNLYEVVVKSVEDGVARVTVNGTKFKVDVETVSAAKTPVQRITKSPAPAVEAKPVVREAPKKAVSAAKSVKSPLPGVILDVKVRKGDTVKVGDTLLILEAMKMENNIDSDMEGTVSEIKVRQGDSVLEGDVLVVIE